MKAKIFIIIGVVIAIPFIAVVGLIVIMSSVIGVVSIGGGSDGSNDSGYLFRDLPFLADYYTCTSDFGSRSNPTGQGIVYHQGIDLVAFKKDGTVTAGNASGINDGAAMLVVMAKEKAEELGIEPLATIVSYGTAGVDPKIMGYGPVPATKKALEAANMTIEDIDLVEANEAFAAQSVAVIRDLNIDMNKVNVNGGAIAIGHPIGCSGARILTTLLYEMKRRDAKTGLATLCIGGGMGTTLIVKR